MHTAEAWVSYLGASLCEACPERIQPPAPVAFVMRGWGLSGQPTRVSAGRACGFCMFTHRKYTRSFPVAVCGAAHITCT